MNAVAIPIGATAIVLLCLFCMIRPETAMILNIRLNKFFWKIMGFEIEIKATPRAKKIWQIWSIFMFCVISAATIAIWIAFALYCMGI